MCSTNCGHTNGQSSKAHRQSHNPLGLAGFLISLFGLLFTFGILCPLGLLLSFFGLFSRQNGFAIAGMVLGTIGSLFVAAGVATVALAAASVHHYQVEVPQQRKTYEVLSLAELEIEQYRQENGKLPEGIEGNKLVLRHTDAYGTEVRYDIEESGGFSIRSAGPDGTFDTADDLTTRDVRETPRKRRASRRQPIQFESAPATHCRF